MIFRSSKNNYQNYNTEELYTNEYVENVNGKSTWNTQNGIEANKPQEYKLDNAFIPIIFITNGTEYTVEDHLIKEPNKTTKYNFALNALFDENYRGHPSKGIHLTPKAKDSKINTFKLKFEVKKGNKEANDSDGGKIKPYIRYYETEKGKVKEKGKYLAEIKVTYDSTFELVLDKNLRLYQISFYSNDDSIFDGGIPKDLFCGSVYLHTCYCNRDFKEYEVQKMVMELRKKDDVKDVPQFAPNGKDFLYVNENDSKGEKLIKKGKDGYYGIKSDIFVTKVPQKIYKISKSKFEELGTSIFQSERLEKIQSKDADFEIFTKELNLTLKTYNINTCLRKIHFLGQCYHETGRFVNTYEGLTSAEDYNGGVDFQGRGLKQITHDVNYLEYYDKVNNTTLFKDKFQGRNKEGEGLTEYMTRKVKHGFPTDFLTTLKTFAKKISTELYHACDSAGWFWNLKKINQYADIDNVNKITTTINGGANGIIEREKYANDLKTIFKYEKRMYF